ncbi:response regulator [Paenibacillus sp. MER 99-2]|uniref:response regulator n=1 Tax=Paenibacillus sp. MER 99-2 TaxID=2939572 RepID=UPI00203FC4A0|nr:response regulator [Paenibacillus sp. MER 99-2]MCM3175723.1 response regulator [Paenibacillus sp. MER 99-2]
MKTIMLVDDDPHIIKALTDHIHWSSLGLRIAGTAANGIDALELFHRLQPDLVMTDVYLPGMTGLEVTQALRKEHPHLPIIILSGYDEFENARAAMRWGVNHFLLKPAEVEEIESVLRDVLLEQDVRERHERLERTYKQEIGRVLPYLRKHFLHELLTTRYRADELPDERISYVGIQKSSPVRAISLQLNRPGFLTRMKERDWQLLRYGAADIIQETIKVQISHMPDCQVEIVDYSDRVFVLLLFAENDYLEQVQSLVEQMIDQIFTYLKLELSAGIGSVKGHLCEVMDSYLESREALEAAEFQGGSRVYRYQSSEAVESSVADYSLLLRQWNEAWVDIRPDLAEEVWHHIRSLLDEGSCNGIQDVQVVAVSLFDTLIHSWNRHYPMLAPPLAMGGFLQEIQSKYALQNLISWLDDIIHNWLEQTRKEMGEKKSNKLVEQVKRYVELHYAEEISFEAIAKGLFVHPKYLSQLFKRVSGENFVSYLNGYRVQQAMELLQSGNYMVYEVSEMTGFRNATYFSQVFKMLTGKSPSEVG